MIIKKSEFGQDASAKTELTRRKFITTGAGALAGAALAGPLWSLAGCGSPPPLTDRSVPRVLADLHVHSMINKWNRVTPLGIRYPGIASLAETTFNRSGMKFEDCYKAGVDLICATHFNVFDEWLSMPTDPDPEAPTHTYLMLDQLERELRTDAAPFARLATNPNDLSEWLDIPKESKNWRVVVVHTIEGGHALGGRLDAIEALAKRGVAMLGLTHFFNKGIATSGNSFPFFPDAGAAWPVAGLSDHGREVIKEVERQGIIVDVIHATSTALKEIFDVTTRPMVASHSAARTLGDHPYSLLDEHIEEIARRQGLIGVIVDPYLLSNYGSLRNAEADGSLRDVVRTIHYLVKLVGHKHVSIGTDFGGFIGPPNEMKRVSQIGKLRAMLLREFNESITSDILANNAIKFLIRNWQPRA